MVVKEGALVKNYAKPVLFSAATVAVMAGAAMSVITVPSAPSPRMSGIDIAVSAVAASTGSAKSFAVFNPGGAAGLATTDIAIAVSTTSCNVQPTNSAPYDLADWYAPFDSAAPTVTDSAKHPYINTNIYRLNAEGRLEQLAASWTKHGWYAASASQGNVAGNTGSDACGTGTCPSGSPANDQLGANCADTYNSGHNSDRYYMGPRSEISARGAKLSPGWAIRGTYLDAVTVTSNVDTLAATTAARADAVRTYTGSGTAQSNKLATFAKADVSTTALGPNGRVIMEAYYVVNGDVNKLNNFAFRSFTSNHNGGTGTLTATNLNFATTASPFMPTVIGRHTYGPAMFQWGDQQQQASPTAEGSVYAASRVVNNGDGTFRYEYNILNVDLDRGVEAVSIPLANGITLSNVSFRQPRLADPAFDIRDWVNQIDGVTGNLVYSAQTPTAGSANWTNGQPMKSNSIRYGTMYSFWFTSDLPPRTTGQLVLTPSGTGSVTSMNVQASVPRAVADIAGSDQGTSDGIVDGSDFIAFINAFAAGEPAADLIGSGIPLPDGTIDGDDFIAFINSFSIG
jgi:hypothetical protein